MLDSPGVKERYRAFWAHALHDRPLLAVTAPLPGQAPSPSPPPRERWTSIDCMIQATLGAVDSTWYGGEALPALWHGWSAGHALPLGCEPHFAEDTVWVDPAPVGGDGFPRLRGWRTSPWWSWMKECTARAAEASLGRYFVMPMWGNHAGDTLALARGSERLMLDLAENRDWARRAVREVSAMLLDVYAELWRLVAPEIVGLEGSIDYVCLWSPGRTMGFDCDISCMVSSRDFEELFLPPLVETMRTVDNRIYHLDGPGAIHHLDLLLAVPEIQAIQWVPGDGQSGVLHWVPLIRRVQAAGRSIVVYARPGEVLPLLDEVRPEGLYVGSSCATEVEGRALVEAVVRRFGGRKPAPTP